MKAFAYYRTSSGAGVGDDKDSEARQRAAVQKYALANNIEIVAEYYDQAIKGADLIENRPEFARLLADIASNGVRTIIVETANRFARDLMTQETGHAMLKRQGIDLIAADSPQAFVEDTPTATLIRQILGAVAQFEKAALVAKLTAARRRTGRMGGNPSLATIRPAHIASAKAYVASGLTLRQAATLMAQNGQTPPSGLPYGPSAVRRMTQSKEKLP